MYKVVSAENPTEIVEAKVVRLTRGKVAVVDSEDYETVSLYSWQALPRLNTWYAKTDIDGTTVYMHTLITGYAMTDHRNRDGLDNRRVNLRAATDSQNAVNRTTFKNNTSGHKGIVWHKHDGLWYVRVWFNSKQHSLGLYREFDDAVDAYHQQAPLILGEFTSPCCDAIETKS